MSGLSSGGMDPEEPTNKERKINEDVKSFLLKRSEHDLPRYAARIRTYLDVKRKRQRANEARRNTENEKTKKKTEAEAKEDSALLGNDDDRMSKRSRRDKCERARPGSRGQEPADRCGRRRRRRRRSCRRRRRRRCRRSCSRRRRRRRRRSCSRRRRRRSCRRRRRRSRCRRR